MFKNYLVSAFRNLLRNKFFSIINIGGLAIGLSAVMLITLFIWDELNFDRHFEDADQIYRVELEFINTDGSTSPTSKVFGAVIPGLLQDFDGSIIEAGARVDQSENVISIGGQNFDEEIGFADPAFFDIFIFDYVEGNPERAMPDMSSVVLAQSIATKYFGDQPALGKFIELDDGRTYKVTAVFKDLPRNTSLILKLFFPLQPSAEDRLDTAIGWGSIKFDSYIKLNEKALIENLQNQIPSFLDRYQILEDPDLKPSSSNNLNIINLPDVHFNSASRSVGDPGILVAFGAIAIIILAVAIFNYLSLSISLTITRIRETAIRKAFGADRRHIIFQFLTGTATTTLIALILALGIVSLALPWFNALAEKIMNAGVFATAPFLLGLSGVAAIITIAAGYYPALLLSRIRPAKVLGGGRSSNVGLTKTKVFLLIAQFSVAIALIISTIVVTLQLNFVQSMDSGFDKEKVVIISGLDHPNVNPYADILKERILGHPDIVAASLSDQTPGVSSGWITRIDNIAGEQITPVTMIGRSIQPSFVDTYGMSIVAGRNFLEGRSDDISLQKGGEYKNANVLINEQAARRLGFNTPQDAIGKSFFDEVDLTVVGVIGDYLTGSVKYNIYPMVFIIDEEGYAALTFRFRTNNVEGLLADVGKIWSEIAPDRPLRLEFLDERFENLYGEDQKQGLMLGVFAALAVFVSCVGLYGLATFTISQRTREVGLRKVLGASVLSITQLFLWEFTKPVLVANILAWPLAWYLMDGWLKGYVFRIDLGVSPFILAGLLAFLIAWATVAGHAWRVARANPINALRYE